MANFQDILNRPMSETKQPTPIPVGTYLCMVQGQPEFGESQQKKTPFVKFTYQTLQPQDDVDLSSVEGGHAGVVGKTLRDTYYLTEDSLWRLKALLLNLGANEGTPYPEAIAQAPGNQILVKVRHRASQDGTSIFTEVESTAKP